MWRGVNFGFCFWGVCAGLSPSSSFCAAVRIVGLSLGVLGASEVEGAVKGGELRPKGREDYERVVWGVNGSGAGW